MTCRIIRFPALRGPLPGVRNQLSAPWAMRLWPGLPASFSEQMAPAAARGVLPVETPRPLRAVVAAARLSLDGRTGSRLS